jgi:2-keto-3-deoxy-L-rhamnonate aldolase RhmA
MRSSVVLKKLRAGKPVLGVNVNMGPSLITGGLVGKMGYDFAFIDLEHRWFSLKDAAMMCLAIREGNADPVIRIADASTAASYHHCYEIGATGVVAPGIASVSEAEFAAESSKFHPVGQRGFDPVNIDADFGIHGLSEVLEWHNRESFTVLMIEDPAAVDAIDDIAAVPGVDILYVGPGDLSQSHGKPGQSDAPEVKDAFQKVAKACEKHGKWWGTPVMNNAQKLREFMDMGARFFATMSDYFALKTMMTSQLEEFRELLDV